MPQNCFCCLRALECGESQDIGKEGLPASVRTTVRTRGPDACAGSWASQGPGLLRIPPSAGPRGRRCCLLPGASVLLAALDPRLGPPEDRRVALRVPSAQEECSSLPHCRISPPSAWFLLVTGPPGLRRECQSKQPRMCLGLQLRRLSSDAAPSAGPVLISFGIQLAWPKVPFVQAHGALTAVCPFAAVPGARVGKPGLEPGPWLQEHHVGAGLLPSWACE